jgi:hypothetical protein
VKEARWLTEYDPELMLKFVRGKISERKLRLFAVACCRRIWHLLPAGPAREAVEMAEQYADGLATGARLKEARLAAGRCSAVVARNASRDEAGTAAKTTSWAARVLAQDTAYEAAGQPDVHEWEDHTWDNESYAQGALLRDVVNPFHAPALEAALLRWQDGTIPGLAQAIYDERAFDRLPILADALEEAGCTDRVLLDHCRGPGPHVRGCWAVDAILGKP